jgi:hypothetical protein
MPKLTEIGVSLQADNALQLVAPSRAEGPGATMWHTWQLAPGAEWNGWEPFGEPGSGDPGPPTMYQYAVTGQLGVLVVSSGDQAVGHRRQIGREPDKWSDWESAVKPGSSAFGGTCWKRPPRWGVMGG